MANHSTGIGKRIRAALDLAGRKGATVGEIVEYVEPWIAATKTPLRRRVWWCITERVSAAGIGVERVGHNRFRSILSVREAKE